MKARRFSRTVKLSAPDEDMPAFSKRQVDAIVEHFRKECEEHLEGRAAKCELAMANSAREQVQDIMKTLKEQTAELQVQRSNIEKQQQSLKETKYSLLHDLSEGKRIITYGLHDPRRNHVLGTLLKYDDTAARWQVQLDGADKPFKIKPQNLKPLSHPV